MLLIEPLLNLLSHLLWAIEEAVVGAKVIEAKEGEFLNLLEKMFKIKLSFLYISMRDVWLMCLSWVLDAWNK